MRVEIDAARTAMGVGPALETREEIFDADDQMRREAVIDAGADAPAWMRAGFTRRFRDSWKILRGC